MNKYEWDAKFEIGVADIDFQHHYFFDLINRLSNELSEESAGEYPHRLMEELNAYVRFHFISEENMMRRAGYPGLDAHINLHRELLCVLSGKEAALEIINNKDCADEIIVFLSDWFIHHSSKEDRLFANYLDSLRS